MYLNDLEQFFPRQKCIRFRYMYTWYYVIYCSFCRTPGIVLGRWHGFISW